MTDRESHSPANEERASRPGSSPIWNIAKTKTEIQMTMTTIIYLGKKLSKYMFAFCWLQASSFVLLILPACRALSNGRMKVKILSAANSQVSLSHCSNTEATDRKDDGMFLVQIIQLY